MAKRSNYSKLIALYKAERHVFERFRNGVLDTFLLSPELSKCSPPIIHSMKTRLKDPDHLVEKIKRKESDGKKVSEDNFFSVFSDFAGVRVLHLYQDQFPKIHNFIMSTVQSGDWALREKPVAYSWDPDSTDFFRSLNLRVQIKPSHYTSIHYVVSPRKRDPISCEIQVRTLFEEIWGEIDHTINYLKPTNQACKEQLRVLSKLVSTGTRLADSIFRTHDWNS